MTSISSTTVLRPFAATMSLPSLRPLSLLVRDAAAAVGAWRRRRKAIADLRFLNDRCLMDMGIDRADIVAVIDARGADRTRRYY